MSLALTSLTFTTSAQAPITAIDNVSISSNEKPRIIALAPHIVEMLFDVGAGEQIIAATDYADYPEAANAIERIGSGLRIQIERVIELQPDLVIAWQGGNPSDDIARIKQLGYNVIYSKPLTFNDVAQELRYFGQLSGHTEQGNKVAEKFLSELAAIKKQYQSKTPLLGFYEAWSRPLTTIGSGSWPQQFLEVCGVTNPFKGADAKYPQVNIEEILQHNFKVIIQSSAKKQITEDEKHWQRWQIIPAVKHQQMIKLDADIIHRMTTRSIVALNDLCKQVEQSRQYYQTEVSL